MGVYVQTVLEPMAFHLHAGEGYTFLKRGATTYECRGRGGRTWHITAPGGKGAHRPMKHRRLPQMQSDPLWYKDAIIYELHVRAFYDSNGDGMGDFRGLTQKLDYLQDVGVTALWLL